MRINEDFWDNEENKSTVTDKEPAIEPGEFYGQFKFISDYMLQPSQLTTNTVTAGSKWGPHNAYLWYVNTVKYLNAAISLCTFIDNYSITISVNHRIAEKTDNWDFGPFTLEEFYSFIKDYIDENIAHNKTRTPRSCMFDSFNLTVIVEFNPKPVSFKVFVDNLNKLYMYLIPKLRLCNSRDLYFIDSDENPETRVDFKKILSFTKHGVDPELTQNAYRLIYKQEPDEIDWESFDRKYRDYTSQKMYVRRLIYYTNHPEYAHDENIKSVKMVGYESVSVGFMVKDKWGCNTKNERNDIYILLELDPVDKTRYTDENIMNYLTIWFVNTFNEYSLSNKDLTDVIFVIDNGADVECLTMKSNKHLFGEKTLEGRNYKFYLSLGIGNGKYRKFPPKRTNKEIPQYEKMQENWKDVIQRNKYAG